jgi:hypothetical protein
VRSRSGLARHVGNKSVAFPIKALLGTDTSQNDIFEKYRKSHIDQVMDGFNTLRKASRAPFAPPLFAFSKKKFVISYLEDVNNKET